MALMYHQKVPPPVTSPLSWWYCRWWRNFDTSLRSSLWTVCGHQTLRIHVESKVADFPLCPHQLSRGSEVWIPPQARGYFCAFLLSPCPPQFSSWCEGQRVREVGAAADMSPRAEINLPSAPWDEPLRFLVPSFLLSSFSALPQSASCVAQLILMLSMRSSLLLTFILDLP